MRDKSLKNFRNITNDDADDNDNSDNDDENRAEVVHDAVDTGESSGEKLANNINDELEYVGEDEEKQEVDQSDKSDDEDAQDLSLIHISQGIVR